MTISTEWMLTKVFEGKVIHLAGQIDDPLFNADEVYNVLQIRSTQRKETWLNYEKTSQSVHFERWISEKHVHSLIHNSRKKVALEFQGWVIDVLNQVRKEHQGKIEKELKSLQLENRQLVNSKTDNPSYKEIEKTGIVYILTTDKQGVYKCGRSKGPVLKRVRQLQTGCVDNIEVLFQLQTSNAMLLEKVVHYIFEKYRVHSKREHFRCRPCYMKMVVEIAGKMIDVLKSCGESIKHEELASKLQELIQ